MNRNNRLCSRQQSVRTHESDRVREARMGGTHAVALPKASPSEHCETGERTAIEVGHEAQVVAVNIDCVLALVSEADFELAWQVRVPIQGIVLLVFPF